MRVLVRPFVLLALLIAFAAVGQSQQSVQVTAPGGTNTLLFTTGMPQPVSGGVIVGVSIQTTTGFTCTSVTISIVDQNSNTLATLTIQNPGETVTQTFSNLGSNVPIQVIVNAVFQNGSEFDYPYLEGSVVTQ
jgi:hypothetical protein